MIYWRRWVKNPNNVRGVLMSKQYVLVIDEITMAFISKMFPSMQFIEIQGMNIKDNPTYSLLVTPIVNNGGPTMDVAPTSDVDSE